MRRTILFTITLLLSACGGSNTQAPAGVSNQPASRGAVVFIGDSITQFWQNGDPPDYPTASPTLSQHVPGVIDAGIKGQTTPQMLARFQADVLSYRPSVVVITGGTNDILYTSNPNINAISTMAEEASAAGARVIIGTVPPTTHDNALNAIQQFNSQLKILAADYGYTLADYYSVMLTGAGAQDTSLFLPDTIHPNSAGYAKMWSKVGPLLAAEGVSVN